jgi:hypothetical protein
MTPSSSYDFSGPLVGTMQPYLSMGTSPDGVASRNVL